ncbi:MAG: MSHA pilin protein MshC [Phenylobacterium sp.]|jgi:MSHA pilin protein MshC
MNKQYAFTLIELIATISLIGILAVSVAPKFFDDSEFSVFTTRDQLIGQLRLAQLRALNDHTNCYAFQIASTSYGIYQQSVAPAACDVTDPFTSVNTPTTLETNVKVSIASVVNAGTTKHLVIFDSLGKPIADTNHGGSCVTGSVCTLSVLIIGGDTASLCIESEGYIHDC